MRGRRPRSVAIVGPRCEKMLLSSPSQAKFYVETGSDIAGVYRAEIASRFPFLKLYFCH